MEDRHLSVTITTGTVLRTVLVIVGAWLLYTLRDIALVVLTAIVLASAIDPGVKSLVRQKIPRVIAVILCYLLIFSIFFLVFYLFLPLLLEDIATFISAMPSYFDAISSSDAFAQYSQLLGFPAHSVWNPNDIISAVRDALNLGAFDNPFTAATQIFGGVFSFILIIVFSFYFAVVETGVDDFLRIVSPKKHQSYILGLWRRSQHKIGLWMQGQLILGFLMGVLIFLGLTIFQIPHALVLSVIVAIFEIIPVFGPVLAAIPAVMIAFASGGVSLGIVAIIIYTVAQQFENHLIYPQVVTRVVGVPPLLVILAILIGAQLAGFLGIILSVPLAAIIQELVKDLENGRLQEHEQKVAA
jgi:predicted PurR-regulated permease PerM